MTGGADQGLLATLLELLRDGGSPVTSAAVGEAVGVPEEFVDVVEQRLEQNRARGLVDRDPDGRWHLTPTGIAAAGGRLGGARERR